MVKKLIKNFCTEKGFTYIEKDNVYGLLSIEAPSSDSRIKASSFRLLSMFFVYLLENGIADPSLVIRDMKILYIESENSPEKIRLCILPADRAEKMTVIEELGIRNRSVSILSKSMENSIDFNAKKYYDFPWMRDLTKNILEYADASDDDRQVHLRNEIIYTVME